MKKPICFLLLLSLVLAAGCSEKKDYAGVLEDMRVDYELRRDTLSLDAWWEPATSIEDDHLLFVMQSEQSAAIKSVSAAGRCKDTLTCTNFYYDDAAFCNALMIMLVDYRYRQVFLMLSRPFDDEGRFNTAMSRVFDTLKEYAPRAEIFFITDDETDAAAVKKAHGDAETAVYYDYVELKEILQERVDRPFSSVGAPLSPDAMDEDYIANRRETIEWSQIGFQRASEPAKKPRLLLIGDSISWGYGVFMNAYMPGYAIDYLRTSRGIDDKALYRELEFILAQYRYDAIHFNIGLHFHGLDAAGYGEGMKKLIGRLRETEPTAKLYFCNTTSIGKPLRDGTFAFDDEASAAVRARNAVMDEICAAEKIPCLDMYSFALESDFRRADTLHYDEAAYEKMAERIAKFLKDKK